MIRNILIPALAAAALLTVWGNIVWMYSGVMQKHFRQVPMESATQLLTKQLFPESGMYVLPYADDPVNDATFQENYRKGPRAQIFYSAEGGDPTMKREFMLYVAHNFVAALLVVLLLQAALPALGTASARWFFVSTLGAFASWRILIDAIWFPQPLDYHAHILFTDVIGWMLVGLVLAKMVRYR